MINYTKSFARSDNQVFDAGLREYMLKVYNYMAIGLGITAFVAFLTINFEPLTLLMYNTSPTGSFTGVTGIGTLLMIAPIFIGIYFFTGVSKVSLEKSKTLFWIYAATSGLSISYVGLVYTGESIIRTFFICASLFGSMSIYGYTTKKDLTTFSSFLTMGMFGLLIASLVNIFLRSPAIYFATSLIGVVIFTGMVAWDTQKLKQIYYSSGGGEYGQKMAIAGAFTLYLDFINLFLYLIRFFGSPKRD